MEEENMDIRNVLKAYQKTLDFHLTSIQELFEDSRVTLIVRSTAEDKMVCLCSQEDNLGTLLAMVKRKIEDIKQKNENGRGNGDRNGKA